MKDNKMLIDEDEAGRLFYLYDRGLMRQRLIVWSRFDVPECIDLGERGSCYAIEICFLYSVFSKRTGEEVFITDNGDLTFPKTRYTGWNDEPVPQIDGISPVENIFKIIHDKKHGYRIVQNTKQQNASDYIFTCLPTGSAMLYIKKKESVFPWNLEFVKTSLDDAVNILIQNEKLFEDEEFKEAVTYCDSWMGVNVGREDVHLGSCSSERQIQERAAKLNQRFPFSLWCLYRLFNGCKVDRRKWQVYPLNKTYLLTSEEMRYRYPNMQQGIVFGKGEDGFPVWIDTDDGHTIHHFKGGLTINDETWNNLSEWLREQLS